MSIDALYNELAEAQRDWGALHEILRRANYDTASPRAAIDAASVDEMHSKVLVVFEALNALRPQSKEDTSWPIFLTRLNDVRTSLKTFKANIQSPLNQARSYQRDDLIIRDQNGNFSWQFLHGESNVVANADVASAFQAANAALLPLLASVAFLLPLCKAQSIGDLSERAKVLSTTVAEVEAYRSEAQRLAKAAAGANDKAANSLKSCEAVLSSAQTTYAAIQATQQLADKDHAAVTALVAQIKATGANADTLEQLVAGYRSKFEAFQSQLDDRLKQFAEFEASVTASERKNAEREAEIDRLVDKADSMIKGATTAGLSKSLEDAQSAYGRRMIWSGGGFIVSIVLLAVSALPLAAHLLPGLLDWIPVITEDVKNTPVAVLGKIVLLLPATWLTIFFSKAFSEFFHLEREYAHKAALAKSIEGFKREAPDFKQEITTGVFGEILNNPSSRQGPEPANHPIYEVLTKRLFQVLDNKSAKS